MGVKNAASSVVERADAPLAKCFLPLWAKRPELDLQPEAGS